MIKDYPWKETMIKDSGRRIKMEGMVRDVTDDKIDYTLALDGPLFERFARHLTDGAKKYSKRNWMGAHTEPEYLRFRESLVRHFIQYLRGDTDEDHFAAIVFNLNGMEYVKERLEKKARKEQEELGKNLADIIANRRTGPVDRRICKDAKANGYRRMDGARWGRRRTDDKPRLSAPTCGK